MTNAAVDEQGDEFPWSIGVFDAHCHPTDTMSAVSQIPHMKAKALTIMATRAQDQELVADVADRYNGAGNVQPEEPERRETIIPAFGWHPWFSHQVFEDSAISSADSSLDRQSKIKHYQDILNPQPEDMTFLSSLPDPKPLSQLTEELRLHLRRYPLALVGEVGIDKAFRLPETWLPNKSQDRDETLTPGGREGRHLSRYRVQMQHQRKVLLAQLRVAAEMKRAVSVHGVQAHGFLYETLRQTWQGYERESMSKSRRKRQASVSNAHANDDAVNEAFTPSRQAPFPPRICLHSYSGPPETAKQYLQPSVPAEIYFSFSVAVNFSTSSASKTQEVIKMLPQDKILVESDLHIAGDNMDSSLESIARKICSIRGWTLRAGVEQLKRNWESFVYGS